MRYFKIPLCRIFTEKSEIDQGQMTYECRVLGQKLGYDNDLNDSSSFTFSTIRSLNSSKTTCMLSSVHLILRL